MTPFEKSVLGILEVIEADLSLLVEQGATSSRGAVRDDADAANQWARIAARTFKSRNIGGYGAIHEELERVFAAGFSSGGDSSPMTTARAVQVVAQSARKCECGRANRCAFPSGLCPGERARDDSVVALVAETIMFPKIGRVEYDVISEGPGMKASPHPDDQCVCGHTRRVHSLGMPGTPCCARKDADHVCPCPSFTLRRYPVAGDGGSL